VAQIVFPKRLEEGIASSSYGIHVAKLAGLPQEVVFRALQIESELQAGKEVLNAPNKKEARESAAKQLFQMKILSLQH